MTAIKTLFKSARTMALKGHSTTIMTQWRKLRRRPLKATVIFLALLFLTRRFLWHSEYHVSAKSILSSDRVTTRHSVSEEGSDCHRLPSGGELFIIWAYDRAPNRHYLSATLNSLRHNYPSTYVNVLCGSRACTRIATMVMHSCVKIRRLVVPDILAGTPLESWGRNHILAKLLSAHHFENILQVAIQVTTLWRFGGVTIMPGLSITGKLHEGEWIVPGGTDLKASWFPRSSSCLALEEHQSINESYLPGKTSLGLLAISAHQESDFLTAVLKHVHTEFQKPYNSSQWPVSIEWTSAFLKINDNDKCCTDMASRSSGNCVAFLGITEAQLKDERDLSDADNSNDRHFGTLSYNARRTFLKSVGNPGMNIGDEIQGLAGIQFLPYLDAFVERDRADVIRVTTSKKYSNAEFIPLFNGPIAPPKYRVTTIMNAWYASKTWVWPPSVEIDPIFVAVHLQPNSIREDISRSASYLKLNGPIGARDYSTLDFLKKEGIPSFFSGCMTLTLAPLRDPLRQERKEVLFVDVAESLVSTFVPQHILSKAQRLSHKVLDPEIAEDRMARYYAAFQAITRYSRAKLVVTQRLHVALPCAAMGTPVILVKDAKLPGGGGESGRARLSGLSDFVHVIDTSNTSALLSEAQTFEWNAPPQTPFQRERLRLRDKLISTLVCHPEIYDSSIKFGMHVDSSEYEEEENICASTEKIPKEAIHVATSLDMNWFSVFPTWINALSRSNSKNAVVLYLLTNGVQESAQCMLRIVAKNLMPSLRLVVVPTEKYLEGTKYKPNSNHQGRISITTQSRLYLSSLLPCVDKLLWLDLDTLVLRSLAPLWNTELDSKCKLSARTSVMRNTLMNMSAHLHILFLKDSDWENMRGGFNAGVMLMSLNALREQGFEEKLVSYFAREVGANDQIVYNMACNGTHNELDVAFNIFSTNGKRDVADMLLPSQWAIIHFTGRKKPFMMSKEEIANQTDVRFRFWEKYAVEFDDLFPSY